jgi:hypothetical protein
MKYLTKSPFQTVLLFVIALSISLISCSETQPGETSLKKENLTPVSDEPFLKMYTDLVIPNSGLLFRGIDFDMSRTEVRKIEINRAACSETIGKKYNQLIITTDLGPQVLDFADLKYTFDEKGLYFIEVETYAITKEKSSYLYNKIKDYYVASLGESTVAEDGYLEFKGANKKYNYQVAMKEILLEATETEEESYGIFLLFSMK